MTDTPWTPGPWRARTTTYGENVVESLHHRFEDGSESWHAVFGCGWPEDPGLQLSEADARLISVAPEMADWIDEVLTFVGKRDTAQFGPALTVNQLRQGMFLLARARGER